MTSLSSSSGGVMADSVMASTHLHIGPAISLKKRIVFPVGWWGGSPILKVCVKQR